MRSRPRNVQKAAQHAFFRHFSERHETTCCMLDLCMCPVQRAFVFTALRGCKCPVQACLWPIVVPPFGRELSRRMLHTQRPLDQPWARLLCRILHNNLASGKQQAYMSAMLFCLLPVVLMHNIHLWHVQNVAFLTVRGVLQAPLFTSPKNPAAKLSCKSLDIAVGTSCQLMPLLQSYCPAFLSHGETWLEVTTH